jgi:hypothetical protein
MSVVPPNSLLAKLSIAAIELINDVERQGCRFAPDLRLAHFGGIGGERVKGSFQPLFSMVLRGNNTLSIMLSHAGPVTRDNSRLPGKPAALPGFSDLVRPRSSILSHFSHV